MNVWRTSPSVVYITTLGQGAYAIGNPRAWALVIRVRPRPGGTSPTVRPSQPKCGVEPVSVEAFYSPAWPGDGVFAKLSPAAR